jgi:hypothetical protein
MPRSFRSPLDGFDSPFGPTRIPGWLSAFAPWASYAYGTTGLTTPQFYNMSLAEDRAGEALKLNAAGVYVGIPANTPPILGGAGHDVFGAYTNGVRNPRFEGATVGVIGSGGVLPTNMELTARSTAVTVMGTGTAKGLPYLDIGFAGTVSGGGDSGIMIGFEPGASPIVASEGQVWTESLWAEWLEAPTGLFSTPQVSMLFRDSGNTGVGTFEVAESLDTFTRANVTATAPASTAKVQPRLRLPASNGSAISFKLRVYAPQTVLSAFPRPPVLPAIGTPAASTRPASISTVTGQPALGDFRIKLREDITDLTDRTFWSRGPDANNKSELAMIDGKIRQTITVSGVDVVVNETTAFGAAPGLITIDANFADADQWLDVPGVTNPTPTTTAVSVPTGTPRFGRIGGDPAVAADWPGCINMDFAVGPA